MNDEDHIFEQFLLSSIVIIILQNHAIPKEHIMHIMDHKLSVVFGLVFQAMSGSVKNVRMYGVSGVKSNAVTVARDAA